MNPTQSSFRSTLEITPDRVLVDGLYPGPWVLAVDVADVGRTEFPFEVQQPGDSLVHQRVEVGGPGTLAGRIILHQGAALPSLLEVTISHYEGCWQDPDDPTKYHRRPATVDPSGDLTFRFVDVLPHRPLWVRVEGGGWFDEQPFELGFSEEHDVELRPQPSGWLEIRRPDSEASFVRLRSRTGAGSWSDWQWCSDGTKISAVAGKLLWQSERYDLLATVRQEPLDTAQGSLEITPGTTIALELGE